MKKVILPFVVLALLITGSFAHDSIATGNDKDRPSVVTMPLGEFLYTVPLRKEISLEDAQTEWYHEYLEPGLNDSLFEPMLDLVKRKEITVYEPVYPFKTIMDPQAAYDLLVTVDSIQIEDPGNPGIFIPATIRSEYFAHRILSLTFHEEWSYDPATLTLIKKVKGIIPNLERSTDWGQVNSMTSFYIPVNNQPGDGNTRIVNGITSDFISDGTIHSGTYEFESMARDSAISVNQSAVTARLLADINTMAQQKKFVLYEPDFPFTNAIDNKMKAGKLPKLQQSNMLLFYEDWEINPRKLLFEKRVKGVIPERETKVSGSEKEIELIYDRSALVPFNGFLPQSKVPDLCHIEAISYDIFYKDGFNRYPGLTYNDSIFIDSVAMDIREHILRMEVKSFGRKDWYNVKNIDNGKALTREGIDELFFATDSVIAELVDSAGNWYIENQVRRYEYEHNLTTGLRFFESWTFDFTKQTFVKQTRAIGLHREVVDYGYGGRASNFICFYFCPLLTPGEAKSAKYLYTSSVNSGCLLNYNEFNYNEGYKGDTIINYADNWEENIDPSKRYALIQPVIDMIRAGKMKAYKPGQMQVPMAVADFNRLMTDIAAKYKLQVKPGMEFLLFNHMSFQEQWYYNRVTGQIYKEVSAITFAHRDWDVYNIETYERQPVIESCFTIRVNMGK